MERDFLSLIAGGRRPPDSSTELSEEAGASTMCREAEERLEEDVGGGGRSREKGDTAHGGPNLDWMRADVQTLRLLEGAGEGMENFSIPSSSLKDEASEAAGPRHRATEQRGDKPLPSRGNAGGRGQGGGVPPPGQHDSQAHGAAGAGSGEGERGMGGASLSPRHLAWNYDPQPQSPRALPAWQRLTDRIVHSGHLLHLRHGRVSDWNPYGPNSPPEAVGWESRGGGNASPQAAAGSSAEEQPAQLLGGVSSGGGKSGEGNEWVRRDDRLKSGVFSSDAERASYLRNAPETLISPLPPPLSWPQQEVKEGAVGPSNPGIKPAPLAPPLPLSQQQRVTGKSEGAAKASNPGNVPSVLVPPLAMSQRQRSMLHSIALPTAPGHSTDLSPGRGGGSHPQVQGSSEGRTLQARRPESGRVAPCSTPSRLEHARPASASDPGGCPPISSAVLQDYLVLYRCDICGKCFPKAQALGGHMGCHRKKTGPAGEGNVEEGTGARSARSAGNTQDASTSKELSAGSLGFSQLGIGSGGSESSIGVSTAHRSRSIGRAAHRGMAETNAGPLRLRPGSIKSPKGEGGTVQSSRAEEVMPGPGLRCHGTSVDPRQNPSASLAGPGETVPAGAMQRSRPLHHMQQEAFGGPPQAGQVSTECAQLESAPDDPSAKRFKQWSDRYMHVP